MNISIKTFSVILLPSLIAVSACQNPNVAGKHSSIVKTKGHGHRHRHAESEKEHDANHEAEVATDPANPPITETTSDSETPAPGVDKNPNEPAFREFKVERVSSGWFGDYETPSTLQVNETHIVTIDSRYDEKDGEILISSISAINIGPDNNNRLEVVYRGEGDNTEKATLVTDKAEEIVELINSLRK